MLDWTYILLLSLGATTAKVDLNSHQPLSAPAIFPEASFRFEKNTHLGYFGGRLSYYNVPLEVSPIFQNPYGETSQIHNVAFTLFLGKGFEIDRRNKIGVDGGLAVAFDGGKLGFPARLRYVREYRTKRQKRFNASVSVGMDFWAQDNFDNHRDVTTRDADMMFMLNFGIELPWTPGP